MASRSGSRAHKARRQARRQAIRSEDRLTGTTTTEALMRPTLYRSTALPMTGAMRSGDGKGQSLWARPSTVWDAVIVDARWDDTVTEVRSTIK